MKEKVCVVGATGYLGISVVEELRRRGIPLVAVARNATSSNIERLRQLDATVEFVDASKPHEESYAAALNSVTTCVSCLAAGYKNVDETSDFWAIDRDANIRLGREALEAGVDHLLLTATFEGEASRHSSEFSAAKEEAVDTLRREFQSKHATLTVLRPNAYFKDLTDRAFDTVLANAQHTVIGDGTHRINPIAREDVASFIVDCVEKKRDPGKDYLLGGPDVLTYREIGVLAAQVIGNEQTLRIRSVPLYYLKMMSLCLDLLGRWSRPARRKAALLHWMIYCSTHDAVAPCCGQRHLREDYERKFKQLDRKEQSEKYPDTVTYYPSISIAFVVLFAVAVAAGLYGRN